MLTPLLKEIAESLSDHEILTWIENNIVTMDNTITPPIQDKRLVQLSVGFHFNGPGEELVSSNSHRCYNLSIDMLYSIANNLYSDIKALINLGVIEKAFDIAVLPLSILHEDETRAHVLFLTSLSLGYENLSDEELQETLVLRGIRYFQVRSEGSLATAFITLD